MNKFFKFFFTIFFIFKALPVSSNAGEGLPAVDFSKDLQPKTNIALQRLDEKRIEEKQEFFRNLFERRKKFRRNFVITAVGLPVAGLLAYCGYRVLKDDDQNKSSDSSSSKSSGSYSRDSWNFKELWEKEGIKGLCKYGFFKGIGKGIYWGISAIIISSFLAMQTKLFEVVPDKFSKLWNGDDEQRFLLIQQNLGINLEQLSIFIEDQGNIICDKQEIKDNYIVFIDAVEMFVAFTKEKLDDQQEMKYGIQEPINNGLRLLVDNVNDFSKKLEDCFGQSDSKFFNKDDAQTIWQDFRLLNNQLIRFFGLCYNVFYEKQAIS